MKYFRFLLLASVVSLALCMHIPDDADEELELETADQEGMKYCNDWAVEIHGGMEMANKIADKHGFINLGQVGNLKNFYHFQLMINDTLMMEDSEYCFLAPRGHGEFSQIGEKSYMSKTLLEEGGMVSYAAQQSLRNYSHRAFDIPSDPLYKNQWSLLNTGQTGGPAGRDINVVPAWMQGFTGKGVVVGVVDDGLDKNHTDLSPNYDSEASWDFIDNDGDPSPSYIYYSHGTLCAGVIGMEKSNSKCGIGVAYESKVAGLKIDLSYLSDLQIAEALGHYNDHIGIYSNSWGPPDNGRTLEGPGLLTTMTLENGAQNGRNGKGNIYVWAAGNGGYSDDSCVADGYITSIYTIGVGAANDIGEPARYDEQCSAKMVVTYNTNSFSSFCAGSYDDVITTSTLQRCSRYFSGTSASTPLAAGVIALTLQANPSLTWRDVQYLIVYTSNPNDLINGDWGVNGAGLRVSHNHGFGAIDAEAMVTRAKRWINVPPQSTSIIGASNKTGMASRSKPFTATFDVNPITSNITFTEHIVVNMSLSIEGHNLSVSNYSEYYDVVYDQDYGRDGYPKRGDIRVELISPQGTVSVLLPYRNRDIFNNHGYVSWPFMSVHHWGEYPIGQWKLSVYFRATLGVVSAKIHSMTIYGTTEIPAAVKSVPVICHPACKRGCTGARAHECDVCRDNRMNSTLECIYSCPLGAAEENSYCFNS